MDLKNVAFRLMVPVASFALLAALGPHSATAQTTGFVYVATNQTGGNTVIQFSRGSDGSLIRLDERSTGGLGGAGNGVGDVDPLGSQDSLVLDGSGSLLLVVNAGSNELSSMRAGSSGLQLLSKVSSNGSFPNSVALRGDLVFVLNAHDGPNISGFRLSGGTLAPIQGSTFSLPGGNSAAPHDIRFSPDGTRLIVTEGGTNQIDIFDLNNDGTVARVVTQPSAGSGPFGFKFARDGALVVAEADSASASSYFLTPENRLAQISPVVRDRQAASCWISFTASGTIGFVSNTGSGTISSYQVDANGMLTLQNAVAASAVGSAPIDSTMSSDSAYLYVVDSALGKILAFQVQGTNLVPLNGAGALPMSIQGIAAQ
jgi:6-phosphogluconolactonase